MSIEAAGLSAVQARVSQIQSQLESLAGYPSASRTQNPNTNGLTFEQALSRASTGTTTSGSTSNFTPWSSTNPLANTSTKATTASSSVPGVNGTQTADSLIAAAKKYLGVPYKWGGTNPAVGLDCSGLVQRAFKDVGISLPRVAADQAREGTKVESIADAKPGDLVAFGSPVDHIGIYLGDNKMLHAPRTGDVVKIQELYRKPTAIRRILPETPAVSAVAGLPAGAAAAGGAALAQAPATYQSLFVNAQNKYGVSANLLAAVAKQESNFNPRAVSSAGARGLMQIMPGTARGLGVDPNVPEQAVDGAARLLRDHLRKFGSTELALAAYNAGPGAVTKYNGIPPYAETRNYVRKIMANLGA